MDPPDNGKGYYIVGSIFIGCDLSDILEEFEDGTHRVKMVGLAIMPIKEYNELRKSANLINPFPKLWRMFKNDPS